MLKPAGYRLNGFNYIDQHCEVRGHKLCPCWTVLIGCVKNMSHFHKAPKLLPGIQRIQQISGDITDTVSIITAPA
ncbi:hypothetical protein D3C72_2409140 [compost metagenome]